MRPRRHVVWVRYEAGEPWVIASDPMPEPKAVSEARVARGFGSEAKALPEGVDPNEERKAS